ncbi:hypothetical protein Prudu_005831 [Prunus dulcis]|uniref:Uncharacterized protein n=1 Tax=Prunus dulcis TaxID=3755 RepID=A0A4Y1QYF1_PRUDU|nr:hypothetical protein Prudu_005831 [Prunus dulcis]
MIPLTITERYFLLPLQLFMVKLWTIGEVRWRRKGRSGMPLILRRFDGHNLALLRHPSFHEFFGYENDRNLTFKSKKSIVDKIGIGSSDIGLLECNSTRTVCYEIIIHPHGYERVCKPVVQVRRVEVSSCNGANKSKCECKQMAINQRPQQSSSLEYIVKQMTINQSNFQQTTQAAISKLEVQLGQIATEIAQREPGKWPSQTVINPKNQEAKAVHVLRSGMIVDNKVGSDLSNDVVVVEDEDEEETTAMEGEQPKTSQSALKVKSDSQEPNPFQLHKRDDKFVPSHFHQDRYIPPPPYIPPIPFPGRLKKANQDKAFKEIYDILSKVNINLPLLDVVKQIPAYGKFIKHLMTHKLNFTLSEEVKLNKNVSAVLQRKLPPKLEDPGSFNIPINIGDKTVGRAMLDLGASINVMPYSVYQALGLEGIKKTSIRLELADHSIKYPKGIVEDILVQVNTLILPADFVVMDMEDNPYVDRVDPILLGRPFMATADTIIKVKDGTLSMTVLGETVEFKVFDALSQPSITLDTCFSIDVVDHEVSSKIVQKKSNDALEAVLTQEEEDLFESEFQEVMAALEVFQPYPPSFRPPLEPLVSSSTKLEPSIITPPKLELKPLPNHLKYTYLGANETLLL